MAGGSADHQTPSYFYSSIFATKYLQLDQCDLSCLSAPCFSTSSSRDLLRPSLILDFGNNFFLFLGFFWTIKFIENSISVHVINHVQKIELKKQQDKLL